MKKIFIKLVLMGSAFVSTSSYGSAALICKDEVRLFDLWEGQSVYKISIPLRRDAIYPQVEKAMERLKVHQPPLYPIAAKVIEELYQANNSVLPVPSDASLMAPMDLNNLFVKAGCELIGATLYDDNTGKVYFDEKVVYAMNATDQAGVAVHEAVYKAMRQVYGHKDSRKARQLTACLFSLAQGAIGDDGGAIHESECLTDDYR